MTDASPSGLIFISHSSLDKDEVSSVIRSIPKSHLFYDVDTINPGTHTIEALDDGLVNASVFAMFVSPNTPRSVWVDYESSVASFQKIRRKNLAVLAIPIKGATHKEAPDWMQKYMAVPPGYSHSDIARLLKYKYEEVLRSRGDILPRLFVGREDFCNRVVVDTRTKSSETGIPINFLLFAGIPNMGRFSVASNIIPKVYPGSRDDLPVFEIPRYGDAVDLFLALRQDITGLGGPTWTAEQIASFPQDPTEQVTVLMANLAHFARINQTVIVKSAYGLRNQSRTLKPWVEALFIAMRNEPNVRVAWISDRLLAPEALEEHPNALQFQVPELAEEHIVYLLTELLDAATSSPSVLKRVAPYIHGHPGSAHHVASLIGSSQRAPESLIDKPESIISFQERCVRHAISEDSIGALGVQVIRLLKLLPSADHDLLVEVFAEHSREDVADTLWNMTDNCIVTYTMSGGYRLADIVRPISLASNDMLETQKIERLASVLSRRLNESDARLSTIDSLLFVYVNLRGQIPDEFKHVLTGATLQDIVEQNYQLGHKFSDNWQDSFRTAAKLSLLASEIPMALDTLESILFYGADGLIRVGDDPRPIIVKMEEKRLPSVSFLWGSYYYHKMHDPDKAIPYLEASLNARSYIKRTGRLLAKIYMEKGLPKAGLNVFQRLGDRRVNRDSGLLAQKIRCLRAAGDHVEANKLVVVMKSIEDEFGEYDILMAARFMKDMRYDEALEAVSRASQRPKVNRINLSLLETAIRIEKGDPSGLDTTCKMATAIGLDAGAHSLRARAHIKEGNWKGAENELGQIQAKNYYDKILMLRMLEAKLRDIEIIADPASHRDTQSKRDVLLVELRRDGDGEWSYDE